MESENKMNKLVSKNGKLYVEQYTFSGRLSGTYEVLRGWESYSGWFWFATELEEDSMAFGLVQGFEVEWGSFSIRELESMPSMIWEIDAKNLPFSGRRD